MKLTLVCPHCSAELELEDIAPGTVIECPNCHGALAVPDAPTAQLAGQKKQLRLPRRPAAAPSSAPVYIPVPAKRRGIIGGAFHGCGVLLVMAIILAIVIIGCNALVIGGAASALKDAADKAAAQAGTGDTSKPSTKHAAEKPRAWRVVPAGVEDLRAVIAMDRDAGAIAFVGPLVKLETTRDIDPAREEWSAPLVGGGGRELRRYSWTKTGPRVAVLKLVDEKGETDFKRAETFARDVLSMGDGESLAVAYPGRSINHVIMVPVRGLREALAEAGYDPSAL